MSDVLGNIAQELGWVEDQIPPIWHEFRKYTRGAGMPESRELLRKIRSTIGEDWVTPSREDYPLLWDKLSVLPKVGVKNLSDSLLNILTKIGKRYPGQKTHFNASLPKATKHHLNFSNDRKVAKLYDDLVDLLNLLEDADVTAVIGVSIFKNVARQDWVHFFQHMDALLGGTQIVICHSNKVATVQFFQDGHMVGVYEHPVGVSVAVQSGINGQSAQEWDNPEGLTHSSKCADPERICVRIRLLGFLPLHLITSELSFDILEMIDECGAIGGDKDNR